MAKFINVQQNSIRIVIASFAAMMFIAAANSFGVFRIPNINSIILSVTASLVVFVEVGLIQVLQRKKGLDLLGAFGVVAGLLLLGTSFLELINLAPEVLLGIKGLVFGVLGFSFLWEIFTK